MKQLSLFDPLTFFADERLTKTLLLRRSRIVSALIQQTKQSEKSPLFSLPELVNNG